MVKNTRSLLLALAITLVSAYGCSSDDDPAVSGDDQQETTTENLPEVADGYTRLFVGEKDAVSAAGVSVSWDKVSFNVNGASYSATKSSGGAYYVDVPTTDSYTGYYLPSSSSTWYGASAYSDLKIPYSQFYSSDAAALKTYPLYAKADAGGNLEFGFPFALLDISLTGDKAIASIKVENPAGGIIAGSGTYMPSSGLALAKGVDFAVLNCTDNGDCVALSGSATHFFMPVLAGTYSSGLNLTITSSDHLAMEHTISSAALVAGEAYSVSLSFSPDDDLVYYESFDTFVWGGNIMGGEGTVAYAPDASSVTYNTCLDRDGYANAFTEVAYNVPGAPFVQSNTWDDVSNLDVLTSHQTTDSYVYSRNIGDYIYLFRCFEYQGCIAVGPGSSNGGTQGRGILQTGCMTNISGMTSLKVEFDFCYEYGATDDMVFNVYSGLIDGITIDGAAYELTSDNFSYALTSGNCIVSRTSVSVPASNSEEKSWHHVVADVKYGCDGTRLDFRGNTTSSATHGFYIDNIEVRTVGSAYSRPSNTLRVMSWNIQNGMWADQANNYDNFVAFVKKYDPDVCVWCEASTIYKDNTNTSASSSEKYLPDGWTALAGRYGHSYVATGGVRDNYPQVITAKYPITTILKMTETDDSSLPLWHGAALHSVSVNNSEIYFVTLHLWPWSYASGATDQDASAALYEGEAYREHEIEYILGHTINNSQYASQQDWLMMGDFNSRSPVDNGYYKYTDDVRFATHNHIIEETDYVDVIAGQYSGFFVPSLVSGSARIDYMYASPSMYNRIDYAATILDSWTFGRTSQYVSSFYEPSDHLPILADYRLD